MKKPSNFLINEVLPEITILESFSIPPRTCLGERDSVVDRRKISVIVMNTVYLLCSAGSYRKQHKPTAIQDFPFASIEETKAIVAVRGKTFFKIAALHYSSNFLSFEQCECFMRQ